MTVFDWEKYKAAVENGVIPSDLQPKEFTGGQPPMLDWWEDIRILGGPKNKERVGYPTQKPLALYERIIEASSNEGDIVLDPFCGCATTPIAAERLKRQWAGIDIWDKAHETVLNRLVSEGLAIENGGGTTEILVSLHLATFTTRPNRPSVQMRERPPSSLSGLRLGGHVNDTRRRVNSMNGWYWILARSVRDADGITTSTRRVLEVDHIRPKSDGGSDAYDNLTLLCPPCNRAKLDRMTLTGLQEQNRRDGYLLSENEQNLRIGRAQRARRRRRR